MNFRLTAALFGIVFVLGAILLALSLSETKKLPSDAIASELALNGKKTEDVDAIEFERPGNPPLVIVRTNKEQNTWQIQQPITANADAAKVQPVIIALLRAKPTPYPGISSNPAAHGLDPAGLKVKIKAGDVSSTINLGDVTLGDKGVVFVTTSAQSKRPMAVRRSDLDALFREPKDGKAGDLAKWTADFRTSGVFPSDPRAAGEDVASVRVDMPNKKKELALSRTASGAWKFDSPAGWGDADIEGDAAGSPNTFTGVRRLLGALTSVSAANPGDFIDSPKDPAEYGLDAGNPDLVKVELKTRDGQSATVYFGKREGPPALPPGMPPMPHMPGSKVYIRVEGQPGVIRATSGDLSGLTGVALDPSPLRDRTLVTADRAKADGIDIVLAGQPADRPTKLRRAGPLPLWKLYGGPKDPQPAFGAPVEKLLDVVFARRSITSFPAPNPQNFAAVSATVFVWVDGFNPPIAEKAEPAKKGEPIKIEFGRKEGEMVYVRRTLPGQPPNEFTIPAQLKVGVAGEPADVVTTVGLSRLELLDRSLPTFSDAARITVTGSNTYTLVRDEKPDPLTRELLWRFDTADPRKGQVADGGTVRNEMIYTLANANSAFGRFVDEDPTPEKVAEYGLAPPRLKVVADMPPGAEPKQVAFEFGKDTGDPDKVYARVPGRTAVFTVQRRVFDRCANPDLRDRVIFRGVPAPAVTKVELKGWGDAGFQTELTFEKNKEGAWAATKAPAGFVVDPVKVNTFLEHLSRLLQVKTFEKGVPQSVHGFGDPKHALQVTLHWPGGAAALNLGATPDNGATYYGWSGWLPQTDPVFTFDGALFKPFKDKPGGFAK